MRNLGSQRFLACPKCKRQAPSLLLLYSYTPALLPHSPACGIHLPFWYKCTLYPDGSSSSPNSGSASGAVTECPALFCNTPMLGHTAPCHRAQTLYRSNYSLHPDRPAPSALTECP